MPSGVNVRRGCSAPVSVPKRARNAVVQRIPPRKALLVVAHVLPSVFKRLVLCLSRFDFALDPMRVNHVAGSLKRIVGSGIVPKKSLRGKIESCLSDDIPLVVVVIYFDPHMPSKVNRAI
jgi:hypothetical protein